MTLKLIVSYISNFEGDLVINKELWFSKIWTYVVDLFSSTESGSSKLKVSNRSCCSDSIPMLVTDRVILRLANSNFKS